MGLCASTKAKAPEVIEAKAAVALDKAFERADKDNTGSLSLNELVALLTDFGFVLPNDSEGTKLREITGEVMKKYDVDNSGSIDREEFVSLYTELKAVQSGSKKRAAFAFLGPLALVAMDAREDFIGNRVMTHGSSNLTADEIESLKEEFDKIDRDSSGDLRRNEMIQAMEAQEHGGQTLTKEQIESHVDWAFSQMDYDKSGTISFEEYVDFRVDLENFAVSRSPSNMAAKFGLGPLAKLAAMAGEGFKVGRTISSEKKQGPTMSVKDYENAKQAFAQYDLAGDGVLDKAEIISMVLKMGFQAREGNLLRGPSTGQENEELTKKAVTEIFSKYDINKNEKLEFKEFVRLFHDLKQQKVNQNSSVIAMLGPLAALSNSYGRTISGNSSVSRNTKLLPEKINHLKKVFATIDTDGSGEISQEELIVAMKNEAVTGVSDEKLKTRVDKIYAEFDLDKSGGLQFEEFCEAWGDIEAWNKEIGLQHPTAAIGGPLALLANSFAAKKSPNGQTSSTFTTLQENTSVQSELKTGAQDTEDEGVGTQAVQLDEVKAS